MDKVCRSCVNPVVLTETEVDNEFSKLSGGMWTFSEGKLKLLRKFTCRNWKSAIDFINKVSDIAEDQGHHPDIALVSYRNIELSIYTHSAAGLGLTIADFELAAALEKIEVDYSPKWLKEQERKEEEGKL